MSDAGASDNEQELQQGEVEDLSSDAVVDKYRQAGDIVNNTLKLMGKVTVPGKSTVDVASIGDQLVKAQVANAFKSKKKLKKGSAFPVCVSVNECVGNASPLKSDEGVPLKEGDVVKVAVGVHIDGYVAVGAHTYVVRPAPDAVARGPAADATLAAYYGAQAALKTMRVGAKNYDVTRAVNDVAKCFAVNTVTGVLMHQMKR